MNVSGRMAAHGTSQSWSRLRHEATAGSPPRHVCGARSTGTWLAGSGPEWKGSGMSRASARLAVAAAATAALVAAPMFDGGQATPVAAAPHGGSCRLGNVIEHVIHI